MKPAVLAAAAATDFERHFWSRVAVNGACWDWQGAPSKPSGYGKTRGPNGTTQYAHRLAYVLTKSEIPSGLIVMHACDRRMCVNPDHLSLGTVADNQRDMAAKGRSNSILGAENAAKTRCPAGHPYAGQNLYVYPDGRRRKCWECMRANQRRAVMKRREALAQLDLRPEDRHAA